MDALTLLLLLSFSFFLIPIIGITVTLLRRRNAVDSGQITASPTTNILAIVAFVLSLLALSIPAVICGHIALSQIKKTNERGWAFAASSLWIGYYGIVVGSLIAATIALGLALVGL